MPHGVDAPLGTYKETFVEIIRTTIFLTIKCGIMTVAKFAIVTFFTRVLPIALKMVLYGFCCRLFNLFSCHNQYLL